MRRTLRYAGRIGRLAPLLAVAALALAAAPADATPPADASQPPSHSQTEHWQGRYCPLGGCAGRAGSPFRAAVGFGMAIVATGWVAHRQR